MSQEDNFLKEIQDLFLVEARENLAQTESLFISLEKEGVDHEETFIHLKRLAHNFKGSGKAVGFDELSTFSHTLENLLIALSSGAVKLNTTVVDLLLASNDALKNSLETLRVDKSAKLDYSALIHEIETTIKNLVNVEDLGDTNNNNINGASAFQRPMFVTNKKKQKINNNNSNQSIDDHIRLPMKKIDDLFNSFGEQVIYLSAIDHFLDNLEENKDNFIRTILNLKKITFDLQQYTLSLRMVNLKNLFGKLERAIRDAAQITEKKVDYQFVGNEQELDKMIVDQISDALTHMVRNAVDHGLETPEKRLSNGKNESGKMSVRAFREAGSFIFEIEDDGNGMDPSKIKEKAIEKKLIHADQNLSESEIYELIFENGFSTKEEISEVSGRGVGMNVVKETIQTLNGCYEIKSQVGKGTLFRIKLPLSLSLYNGLCFTVGESRYIIASSQISEVVNSEEVEIRVTQKNKKVVKIRDNVFNLIDLRTILNPNPKSNEDNITKKKNRDMILVSQVNGQTTCFRINRIIGMMKVVQKPLNSEMHSCPGAVGVTILGDGNPVIILDLRVLRSEFGLNHTLEERVA